MILLLGVGLLCAQPADSLDVVPSKVLEEELSIHASAPLPALPTVSKEDVLAFIDEERSHGFPDPLPFSNFEYPNIVSAYRSGFDVIGLLNETLTLRKEAFPLPTTMHSRWMYLGYMQQFHYPVQQGSVVRVQHRPYELPVSLSRLQGSLGDYDTRYALGSFAKGQLLGFEGLSGQFDYSLHNGWWVDMPSGGSSARQYLAYRHKELFWSLEMGSYSKESGSYELHPAYWHLGNYRVENKHSQLIGQFRNPWLNLSVASFNDRDKANNFSETWQTKSRHIALDKEFRLGEAALFLRHEYRDLQRDYLPAMAWNLPDYKHLSRLDLSSPYFLELKLSLESPDGEVPQIMASASKQYGIIGLGLYSRQHPAAYAPRTRITSPVDGLLMDAADLFSPAESAIFTTVHFADLALKAAFGRKNVEQYGPGSEYSANPNVLRLGADYETRFGAFGLKVNSGWNYQEFDRYLMAAPEFSFASHQSLAWYLSHDNMLEAGFSLYSHSDYYLPNIASPVLIEASTILDAKLAVRISKLFDFQVSARNILSTSLYGLYPIPLSIHAGLRWYFIN